MSVVVTYRGPTAAEATGRYYADAMPRARAGWVPLAVERHSGPGVAELAVTYLRDRLAVAYVIEVLDWAALAGYDDPIVPRVA
jgi:hypothetical protein